ncbi:peptidoglycan DD-metalloendopeptidase family protein [Exiguobacterium sp. s193]|uniref:peptidoglycan DD-metalloendopeptidase family protein n=1 Tax=Exiguobacterium sp. s193 TaxID=2751207 RepID=UPI001BED3964|nr:peptidoglycan DD-metalloendopeptidase family protein [Exiguobacterium sp. s193]
MKKLLTTLTVSAIALAGATTYAVPKADAATTFYKVKVMEDGLRARTGPSTSAGVVAGVDKGDTYKYLGRTGNWTKILYGSSKVYVSSTYVKKYSVTRYYKIKVMADNLRVRSNSSTSSQVVGSIDSGETYRYLGKTGDWIKFIYNGDKRFVYADYVKKYAVLRLTNSGASKASKDFVTPTSGPITQGYGPASGAYGYSFHNGIDYGTAKGTPVYATAAGKVITSKNYGAYGNYIMVKHSIDGASFTSLYAHLNSRNVSVGDTVSQGQPVGTVGATGNAFGTHLHFELHRGTYVYSATSAASSVNPLDYL